MNHMKNQLLTNVSIISSKHHFWLLDRFATSPVAQSGIHSIYAKSSSTALLNIMSLIAFWWTLQALSNSNYSVLLFIILYSSFSFQFYSVLLFYLSLMKFYLLGAEISTVTQQETDLAIYMKKLTFRALASLDLILVIYPVLIFSLFTS